MHISARATARPPSLTSWQAATSPARIAWCTARYLAGDAGSSCGTVPDSADGVRCTPVSRSRWLPAKCSAGLADEEQQVAGCGELGGDAAVDVGNVGDGGDDERRRHGVAPAVAAGVLVVQRVLAGHERRAEGLGGRAAAGDGGDERAERRRVTGVAPREVVEQGDAVGVGADGDDVADRLVDGDGSHRLRVVQPVPRVDADADGDPVILLRVGEDDTVGVTCVVRTGEWAHEGRAADLVVVAVDDGRLGGDVRVGEQGEQSRRRIVDGSAGGGGRGLRRRPRSSVAADGRRGGTRSADRAP